MKKQSLIPLVTALFAVLTLTAFFACSADEGAPEAAQPTTKADILRAKAKEFAKKYGVNMTLNEDNIDSLAQVLTVEQMEKDFADYAANYKGITITLTAKSSVPAPAKHRLSIRRSTTLRETPDNLSGSAEIDGTATTRDGNEVHVGGRASWNFSDYKSPKVYLDLEIGNYYTSGTEITHVSYSTSVMLSFYAVGTTYITNRYYTKNVCVNASYTEGGVVRVSLGLK